MKRLIFLLAFVLMGSSLPTLKYRAHDNNGVPISGAKLYFYVHGTTTPKATYSNEALTNANANPVVADSHGWFGEIYLANDDKYKVVLKTSAGVTIWTVDDISSAQITDSSLAARVLQIASTPMDYGAAGNGSTDDSAAVQAAITGASGVVDLIGKTYRVDTGITLKSGVTIRNGTLDFSASDDDNYLSATGTVGAANPLTGNVSAGAVVIPVTTVAGLTVGDLLWLTSTTAYGATGKKGEICRITSINVLNVYVASPLADSYTTAASASVKEITPKSDIVLDDLTVTANSAATGAGVLFQCVYCDRVTMRGTTFVGIKTSGARFVTSTMINIQAARFSSLYGIATSNGVDLFDSTTGVVIEGGSSFATLYYGIAMGADGVSRIGPSRNITISSSTFEDLGGSAITAGIMSANLSVTGDIIRIANPTDGIRLTSVVDVRVSGTTIIGGDYAIDDTTVTHLSEMSNYFTGQTSGQIRSLSLASGHAVGYTGNQDGLYASGFGSGYGVVGEGGSTNGEGVIGIGTGSGTGITGVGGATGYGITASADTTTPDRSSLHLIPQDTDPAVPASGDVYAATNGPLRAYVMGVWSRIPHTIGRLTTSQTLVTTVPGTSDTYTLATIPANALVAGASVSVVAGADTLVDAGAGNDTFDVAIELYDGTITQVLAAIPAYRPTTGEIVLRGMWARTINSIGGGNPGHCTGTGWRTTSSADTPVLKQKITSGVCPLDITQPIVVKIHMRNGNTTDSILLHNAIVTVN